MFIVVEVWFTYTTYYEVGKSYRRFSATPCMYNNKAHSLHFIESTVDENLKLKITHRTNLQIDISFLITGRMSLWR